MKNLLRIITPNKSINGQTTLLILLVWIFGTFMYWSFSGGKFLPTPLEIISAAKNLIVNHEFFTHLFISTWLCIKAIFFAVVISLVIALLSVLPIFRPFTNIAGKARFLSTVGLTFIFAEMTSDTNSLKISLLVFCITIFMVTSFLGIIFEVKKDELDYARSLKLNEWQTVWEVIILGKADQFLEAVKQNFAIAWMMLAMVENLCRAEGGIGVILFQENKQFHLDSVYAIQIMVLFVGIGLDWTLGFIRRIFCPYSVISLDRK
jgi:NitT/TauT family transport system permease protein